MLGVIEERVKARDRVVVTYSYEEV